MANYNCVSRTNYFRVTDEDAYNKIFSCLVSEDYIEDFTEKNSNGELMHGFGCYSSIQYNSHIDNNDDNYDDDTDETDTFDTFLENLQKILPDDEAFILFESGNEKLRYVTGYATIVTNKTIETLSIEELAIEKCKELIGPDFTTKTNY